MLSCALAGPRELGQQSADTHRRPADREASRP